MANGQTKPGTRKVTVGTLGGAAAAIIIWLIRDIANVPITAEIATALGTVITSIVVYLTAETYTS